MESNAHTLRLFIRFNQSDLMKVCIYSTDCIYRAIYTQKKKKKKKSFYVHMIRSFRV